MGMYTLLVAVLVVIDHDYSGMTWGATLIVPQALEWRIAITHSAHSLNYGILLQGIGGVLFMPLIDAFGRYVVHDRLSSSTPNWCQIPVLDRASDHNSRHGYRVLFCSVVRDLYCSSRASRSFWNSSPGYWSAYHL